MQDVKIAEMCLSTGNNKIVYKKGSKRITLEINFYALADGQHERIHDKMLEILKILEE